MPRKGLLLSALGAVLASPAGLQAAKDPQVLWVWVCGRALGVEGTLGSRVLEGSFCPKPEQSRRNRRVDLATLQTLTHAEKPSPAPGAGHSNAFSSLMARRDHRVPRRGLCSRVFCFSTWAFALFSCSVGSFVPSVLQRFRASHATAMGAQSATDEDRIPPLRYLGDPDLMVPQPEVERVQAEETQNRLAILRAAMGKYGGIGIAAPQIGWWVRAMCYGIEEGNPRYAAAPPVPFQYWINPGITWFSEDTSWMWEGCLSVPGMRGWVQRPREIRMRGLDERGETREVHLKDLPARIAQHEFDHLDGVLFPMRVESPNLLVSQAVFDGKETWATNWPSPGSYLTKAGELSMEK